MEQKREGNTPLADWLKASSMSANKLASLVDVSPNAVYRLARGDSDTIAKSTITNLSSITNLSFEDLILGYKTQSLPCETGDRRIDEMVQVIAAETHATNPEQLATYIADDFRCTGEAYQPPSHKKKWLSFEEMVASNTISHGPVKNDLIAAWWWTPDGDANPRDSRDLFALSHSTYMAPDKSTSANQTLLTLRLEKSINEMEPDDIPQIQRWFWKSFEKPNYCQCAPIPF